MFYKEEYIGLEQEHLVPEATIVFLFLTSLTCLWS